MSFGYSVGDAVLLVQLAWNTYQGAKKACGELDELTREVGSLHGVLQRLQRELANPESLLNRADDDRRQELNELGSGCEQILKILNTIVVKYNALSEENKGPKKIWKRIQFGTGEIHDLADLRSKLCTHTSAITLSINLCSLGSQGRIEKQLNSVGGDLEGIRGTVDWLAANMTAKSGDGTVWTTYEDDDKAFWRELRRGLVKEGYRSSVLHRHKHLIKNYVEKLSKREAFDQEDTLVVKDTNKVEETDAAGKKDAPESLETASHQKAEPGTNTAKDLLSSSLKSSSQQNVDSTGLISEEAPSFRPNSSQSSENTIDPCYTTLNQTPRIVAQEEEEGSLTSEDENSSVDQREEDSVILESEDKDLPLNSDSPKAAMDDSELSSEDVIALALPTLRLTQPDIPASIEKPVGGMSPPRSRSPKGKQPQVTDKNHSMVLSEYIIPKFIGEDSNQKEDSFIYFQDSLLRKFRLPFRLVKSWESMSKFIARSFEHEATTGSYIKRGYYMKTTNGDIIIPLAWEDTIQPDWFIIMQSCTGFRIDAQAAPITHDHALLHSSRSLQDPPECIRFQDILGCGFKFPFDLARKWTGMEQLIKQACEKLKDFKYIEFGYYDLMYLDPSLPNIEERYLSDASIILPQTWEHSVRPNSLIKIAVWAIPMDHIFVTKSPNTRANNSLSETLPLPPPGLNSSAPQMGPCNPHHSEEAESGSSPSSSKESTKATTAPSSLLPVVLIDGLGRSLSFPISTIRSWKEIDHKIKHIFSFSICLDSLVGNGQYSLFLTHGGERLHPHNWNDKIYPGVEITMKIWHDSTLEHYGWRKIVVTCNPPSFSSSEPTPLRPPKQGSWPSPGKKRSKQQKSGVLGWMAGKHIIRSKGGRFQ